MVARPTTRLLMVGSLAAFFLIYALFFFREGPPSPAIRAPGHLDKTSANLLIKDDILKGSVVMPKLGNETAK
jgi:FAD-linked sulfhydryl oxidase